MAVKLDHAPSKAEDAEVFNSVSNLIQAFGNGLNIFKRLRERRRKRKARKESHAPDPTTTAELQLSKSLRKGPHELAERYSECYHGGMGPQFAKGDAIAHASLAEILIKLNTGLVGIIASFLNCDHKSGKSHLELDYKSLTNLSDASRKEALQSMTQLYQRLSQSQLHLQRIHPTYCLKCGSSKHTDCSSRSTSPEKEKRKHAHTRQRTTGPVVTRMPIKSSTHPQLVVVRPKNTRKSSTSSTSSHSTKSPQSSTYSSPITSPLPRYIPIEPLETYPTPDIPKATPWPGSLPTRQRVDSFHDPRPSTWPHGYPAPVPEHVHDPIPKLPTFTPIARRSPPTEKKHSPPPPPPSVSPQLKRRLDKATPSSYTFASDSTKLGEIPQRNWTRPWDYEEAERRNAEAAIEGYISAVAATGVDDKAGRKKGLLRFLRKGGGGGA